MRILGWLLCYSNYISLNKFSYNNVIVGVVKKGDNFYYLYYIIVVIEKDKYGLLSLLHLKVTNIYIYTYNFNIYKKII